MMRHFNGLAAVAVAAVLLLAAVPGALAGGVQLPVPRGTIYPGQVIEGRMLTERDFNSSSVRPTTAQSVTMLIGKVARATLLPNRPVDLDAVRDPYTVTQGQAALLVYQNGALRITSTGLALQSGGPGDVVSVRNEDSGRIVRGTIGPDGSVNVGGP